MGTEQLAEFVEELKSQDEIAVEAMGTTVRFTMPWWGGWGECGCEPAPVQGDQRVGEENRPTRCRGAGAVLGERSAAGGRMEPKQHRALMHMAETRDLLVKQRSALKGKSTT